ncbi:MAG: prefoldin domain-containing protein [Desulfurococcaceae archaeon]
MSAGEEQSRPPRTISLEDLLIRAEELRTYIAALQGQIDALSQNYGELQIAIETLNSLPPNGREGFAVLNRLNSAFIPIKVDPLWEGNIIVNVGLSYYVKTTKEKAVEILTKRLEATRRVLEKLQRDYSQALNEYNALQNLLVQVYSKIREAAERGG